MTDSLTLQLLKDKIGTVDIPVPTCNEEIQEDHNILIKQILNILYEQIFEGKNHKLIRNALIIPCIEQVVIAIRPFVLAISTLFLLSIILTAIVLVVLILKRH